jgi:hypothetical protein
MGATKYSLESFIFVIGLCSVGYKLVREARVSTKSGCDNFGGLDRRGENT